MGSLDGKTAAVTGAGQGIGRCEALALSAEGAHVVVNDVQLDGAEAVVAEIRSAGGSAEAHAGDISDWECGRQLIEQAVAHDGEFDILVCNAGIVRDRMIYNMSAGEWDAVMTVHLRGHFVPLRFAAAHWQTRFKATGEAVDGRVITTTSEAGLYGHPGQANYSAAKAGIIGLTLTAARELERFGVTANVISPRGRTPMTESAFGDIRTEGDFDSWDPANVAPWVIWLAGQAAANVNGQVFVVYGGTVSWMSGWQTRDTIEQSATWTQADLQGFAAARLIPGLAATVDPFPQVVPGATAGDRK